jgi:HlyD family secretion protein
MKRRIVIILVIVAIIIGGYFGIQELNKRRVARTASEFQTYTVERNNLTAIVGATGTVRSNQSAILTWQTTGQIGDIIVTLDEKVEQDQVLAKLDRGSLAQNLILAEADLVSAKRNLENLQNSQLSQAQAQSALANAKDALDTAETRRESKSYARASDAVYEETYANYIMAKDNAKQWEQRYDAVDGLSEDDPIRAGALAEWAAAKHRLDTAEANLRYIESKPDDEEIAIADANLVVAQAKYDDALREWERLKDGPDPDDIAAAQARIDAIEAAINSSKLQAPFAGTVTQITSKVGDQVSPGTQSFRIDDFSHLLVDVQIPEVDINRLKVGMPVRITFDGILNKEYNGKVIEVARVGFSAAGVVNFTVSIELLDGDENVLPGMTAAVNIIVSEIENVLIIPNRAVRIKDGQRVVYILKDGDLLPTSVPITIGAISDLQSEVVEGISEGDIIVLNPPAEIPTGPGAGMGGGRPF